VVAWISAVIAHYVVGEDPDEIDTWFFLVILPCLMVSIAGGVTTFLLGRLAALVPAVSGALLGYVLGIVVLFFAPTDLWRALEVAPPAIWAASFAVLAAGLSCRPNVTK